MKVRVLGSSSSGNSIMVETKMEKLLVDAGLSAKELINRLLEAGERPEDITGILLTHEHTDHIRSVGFLARHWEIPVYMNKETYTVAKEILDEQKVIHFIEKGQGRYISDIFVESFSLPHDAADPVGYNLYEGDKKLSIVMDLGYITKLIKYHVRGANILILESNHDMEMLNNGPYPWQLKQRIKGRFGHLSNQEASEFLSEIAHERLFFVILAHLSEVNNNPDLVKVCGEKALKGCNTRICIALKDKATETIII